MRRYIKRIVLITALQLFMLPVVQAQYSRDDDPKAVYWGDTHLHTNLSYDAYSYGNRNLGPDEAYRFAKGEPIEAHNGMVAQLYRPLDFLVVADHASNMGVMKGLEQNDPNLLKTGLGREWARRRSALENNLGTNPKAALTLLSETMESALNNKVTNKQFQETVWQQVINNAEIHNQPGKFTAFIGYEWTASYNRHRVVIFKDGAEKTKQVIPFSQLDSWDPQALWGYMENYETTIGGEVLAIPHNGNLSKGTMFLPWDYQGNPVSKNYAISREKWEPLVEVTQIKGDSETHPSLSPNDGFAHFERTSSPESKPQYEYARSALKTGLDIQSKIGANPFKFGMIGSTDAHNTLSTVDEKNFWGKFANLEPSVDRLNAMWLPGGDKVRQDLSSQDIGFFANAWRMNAAGLAAVWAEENTRESLFAAMKRKEVYASTGPRITVRFFGGWDYQGGDAFSSELVKIGYEKGVPMGGDLTSAPADKSPTFLIRAVKDPAGANLDRIQVIKGWHDANGDLYEKIYNVALSDGREENGQGKVKPVGNTVGVPDSNYTNTIGDPELAVVWSDPDFNKDELAFYYLRVLEIPTPRWTAYDAKFFQLKDIPEEIPMIAQERAYTSPIWYSPE